MSVLEPEWRARRWQERAAAEGRATPATGPADGVAAPRRRWAAGRRTDQGRRRLTMPSTGPAADAARAAFRERMEAKGHAVENARKAVDGLEAAFAVGRAPADARPGARCSRT